ncbi:hypothetical protein D1BOALGB6SA_8487 [Olavius sp. associated proteobacterium Delta 1]|nr:hypothetical protein D1BOALGB6SA_8487 [Olavius sp. associated proteobacterium Delta 1]
MCQGTTHFHDIKSIRNFACSDRLAKYFHTGQFGADILLSAICQITLVVNFWTRSATFAKQRAKILQPCANCNDNQFLCPEILEPVWQGICCGFAPDRLECTGDPSGFYENGSNQVSGSTGKKWGKKLLLPPPVNWIFSIEILIFWLYKIATKTQRH